MSVAVAIVSVASDDGSSLAVLVSGRTHFFPDTPVLAAGLSCLAAPLNPWVRLDTAAPSCLRPVSQYSGDPSRCRSSSSRALQRAWPTSALRRLTSRLPQSTASIGAPRKRSLLVTSTRPSSSTTAPQTPSRGRLSSTASRGNNSSARPNSRQTSPLSVASIATSSRLIPL